MSTRVIITQPDEIGAPHIHEVHVFTAEGRHFSSSFNVTEFKGGTVLRVSMFSARDGSTLPGHRWFRKFAAKYFPKGHTVCWSRLNDKGNFDDMEYRYRG